MGHTRSAALIESPPVPRLAMSNTDWCEVHDHQVEKGAHGRDQRDEQDTLDMISLICFDER